MLPQRRQSSASFSIAFSSVPAAGVRMHQRPWNSSAKPDSGPEPPVRRHPARACDPGYAANKAI